MNSGKNSPFEKWKNEFSNIKKVIAVTSGKGGVGKSVTSSLLATHLNKKGYKVGILDCDLTGPSVPEIFGMNNQVFGTEEKIYPNVTKEGVKVMSMNLILPKKDDPVIWRGPILINVLKDFWTKLDWGELDFLILDMPPGTGDVPLTIYQSYPIDGVIVVSTPSKMAYLAVKKAYEMALRLNQNILGEIVNMSYYKCKNCGQIERLYGEKEMIEGLLLLGEVPFDPMLGERVDNGDIEDIYVLEYDEIIKKILDKINL